MLCIPSKVTLKEFLEKIKVDDFATAENAPIDMASVCKNNDAFPIFTMNAKI